MRSEGVIRLGEPPNPEEIVKKLKAFQGEIPRYGSIRTPSKFFTGEFLSLEINSTKVICTIAQDKVNGKTPIKVSQKFIIVLSEITEILEFPNPWQRRR